MVRTHPQWLGVREVMRQGGIGTLRAVSSFFSYFNEDAANVRNVPEYGGGGLFDIGCYPITISRFLFGAEPLRVAGCLELDKRFGTDRLASAVLEFAAGQSIFTCSTQAAPYQRVQVIGTRGRLEVEIPFNAPPDRPCRVFLDHGRDLAGGEIETVSFETCDQYTIQGDLFSKAILDGTDVPSPIEDAVSNMACIDAIFKSADTGRWEVPQ